MSNTQEQFDHAAEQWLLKHRYTSDAQTLSRIANRVRENLEKLGGYISTSSFERAYLELLNEKSIKPFRGSITEHAAAATDSQTIPPEIVEFIESSHVSAFEQRRRYANDKEFRRYYDLYSTQKLKEQSAQESGANGSLSVEEYRKLPAATVAQRYLKDRAFRASVDALIASGQI
jgi:hypothetical protein